MEARKYQALAMRTAPETATDRDRLLLGAIGTVGEAGEIAELAKKVVFHGHALDKGKLAKEIGDVLWYLNYLSTEILHADLSEMMDINIEKLTARYPEGFFSSERSQFRAEGDV